MDQRHLAGVMGQIDGLLDGGIAAAHHRHIPSAEEEAVAGGAGRDARAAQLLLARQAEPARLRAGGDDHGIALINVAAVASGLEGPTVEIDGNDGVGDDPCADVCGLGLHLLHEPGALDDIGEAGVVLDIGGGGHLAAGLDALHQYRMQARAGGVDRRRIPRGPGPDDQNPATVHLAHLVIPRLLIHKIETRSRPHKAGPATPPCECDILSRDRLCSGTFRVI